MDLPRRDVGIFRNVFPQNDLYTFPYVIYYSRVRVFFFFRTFFIFIPTGNLQSFVAAVWTDGGGATPPMIYPRDRLTVKTSDFFEGSVAAVEVLGRKGRTEVHTGLESVTYNKDSDLAFIFNGTALSCLVRVPTVARYDFFLSIQHVVVPVCRLPLPPHNNFFYSV